MQNTTRVIVGAAFTLLGCGIGPVGQAEAAAIINARAACTYNRVALMSCNRAPVRVLAMCFRPGGTASAVSPEVALKLAHPVLFCEKTN